MDKNKPYILREYEYYGGGIRVKIYVKNPLSLVITNVELELINDDKILHFDRCEPEYRIKNGKLILDTIDAHNDRTISFYLDPLICAKEGTDINCRVNFKYADGAQDTIYMETPLKIQVICPIFLTEQNINIGGLKELIKDQHSHDSKVYTIPKRVDIHECLKICNNVIQQHDVHHIKTFKTIDEKTYESWYFGKTKVTKKDLVIKCSIRKDTESIEIFVSGNDPKDITGLLAELGRNIIKEFETLGNIQPVFNVVVKNSIIKGSNLLSYCNINGVCGGNVVIEDSFVDGASIASDINDKKKGKSTKFLVVAIFLGVLALGFFGLATFAGDSPQLVMPTPSPTPTIIQTPKPTPSQTVIQTQKVTPTPSPTPIVTQTSDQKTFTNSIGMGFVLIPAGEFDMGSNDGDSDEKPIHRVKISYDFYMGKYEVTQKQWRDVMGTSHFKGDNFPAELAWFEVQDFIRKLNEKEGSNKYRLPTEAEWEYAARAGTTTKYYFGDDETKLGEYAWYYENSENKTHEVGLKKSNSWGLYDMHGNVWEWVQDKNHYGYNGAPTDGSAWESGDNSDPDRVIRGCSSYSKAGGCRSAIRNYASSYRYGFGFRLVMIAPSESPQLLQSKPSPTPTTIQTPKPPDTTFTVCLSGCAYSSIQTAINAANSGDTIKVQSGTYYENIVINKPLTLQGENRDTTIIDGKSRGDVVIINANNTIFQGFKVINSGTNGIKLLSVNNAIISNNNVSNTGHSIALWKYSNNNFIEDNILVYNSVGIVIADHSNYNTIRKNNASFNLYHGINPYLNSNENIIIGNTVLNNGYMGGVNGGAGINIDSAHKNIITENLVSGNNYGIYTYSYYSKSSSNKIYKNNIIGNVNQAYDDSGLNLWDNGTIGNHWSNFDESIEGCKDSDSNGICDATYSIPISNTDHYPLIS